MALLTDEQVGMVYYPSVTLREFCIWSTGKGFPVPKEFAAMSGSTGGPCNSKEWAKGCRKVAWEVALNLDGITAAGLEEAFAKDDRIEWDGKLEKYVLKNRGNLADKMCEVKPITFKDWATELKKAQGRQ